MAKNNAYVVDITRVYTVHRIGDKATKFEKVVFQSEKTVHGSSLKSINETVCPAIVASLAEKQEHFMFLYNNGNIVEAATFDREILQVALIGEIVKADFKVKARTVTSLIATGISNGTVAAAVATGKSNASAKRAKAKARRAKQHAKQRANRAKGNA